MDHLRLGVQDQPDQCGETLSLLKKYKISRMWWHMPVIPATREAEAGELLEPGKWRLRRARIAPLHYSLSDTVRPSQNEKEKAESSTISVCKANTFLLYCLFG